MMFDFHKMTMSESKRKSSSENQIVVIRRFVHNRHLVSDSKHAIQPAVKRKSPQNQARCNEKLILILVNSIGPVGVVAFDFRPDHLGNFVLEDAIGQQRRACSLGNATIVRNGSSNSPLNIEISPALAASQRRRINEMFGREFRA